MSETDTCVSCGETVSVDRFYRAPQNRKGRTGRCRRCILQYMKGRHDPIKKRDYDLRRNYGFGLDVFEEKLASQGNRCAICRSDEVRGSGDWHVDHCHQSGRVRQILCSPCNSGLGMFRDDPMILRAAAGYLEAHA